MTISDSNKLWTMVRKEYTFSDGTRIFYEEIDGFLQRVIEYSYTQEEKQRIEKYPQIENIIASQVRKYKANMNYYLDIVWGIARKLNQDKRSQLYNELKELHDKVGNVNDSQIINKDFLRTFGKYWSDNQVQCAAFFTTIYLAMLDMEEKKKKNPEFEGKSFILRFLETIILKDEDPRDPATYLDRTQKPRKDDIWSDDYSNVDSPYEKYNGYNGYDDDTIDEAFDGYPKATWNVD